LKVVFKSRRKGNPGDNFAFFQIRNGLRSGVS
jgi:hypothetical protein